MYRLCWDLKCGKWFHLLQWMDVLLRGQESCPIQERLRREFLLLFVLRLGLWLWINIRGEICWSFEFLVVVLVIVVGIFGAVGSVRILLWSDVSLTVGMWFISWSRGNCWRTHRCWSGKEIWAWWILEWLVNDMFCLSKWKRWTEEGHDPFGKVSIFDDKVVENSMKLAVESLIGWLVDWLID